ncbi:MAG: TAXI family TRAP transporter solute-binding subunit [Saprospiraceae bacterium]|nr:TAXI family TRAP transporter solute-binding subunit [Saprospiraceae bacterium]
MPTWLLRLTRVVTLLAVTLVSAGMASQDIFVIGTGSTGGNYYTTGQFIKDCLNAAYGEDFHFIARTTNGSNENMIKLAQRDAHFAITQRNVLLNKIYDQTQPLRNLQVIAPLYYEQFLMYRKGEVDIQFDALLSWFRADTIYVGVNNVNAASYTLFQDIMSLMSDGSQYVQPVVGSYDHLTEELLAGRVDLLVRFTKPIESLEARPDVHKVFFSDENMQLLSKQIRHLTPVNLWPGDSKDARQTFGTCALLVGLNESVSKLEDRRSQLLHFIESALDTTQGNFAPTLASLEQEIDKVQADLRYVPLNKALKDRLGMRKQWWLTPLLALFLSAMLIWVLFGDIIMRRQGHEGQAIVDPHLFWIRNKHLILGILAVLFVYGLLIQLMQIGERNFCAQISEHSDLLNLRWADLHFWAAITNLTGIHNDIFPRSPFGQAMLSLSHYVIWLGALLVTSRWFLTYRMRRKKRQGMVASKLSNHTVIAGWNDSAPFMVKEALSNKDNRKINRIVCIMDDPSGVLETHPALRDLHDRNKVEFIKGDARNETSLKMANVDKASAVVLLAEDRSEAADEKTLLRALAIARFCRERRTTTVRPQSEDEEYERVEVSNSADAIYTIAEVNGDKYTDNLRFADVNEIVSTAEYGRNIIVQSMFNHGLTKVLDEMLKFNEDSEIYQVDLKRKEYQHLRNHTFDELLPALRRESIQLLAIKIMYHDQNGNLVIDDDDITRQLAKEGFTRQILLNPISDLEKQRQTDADDHLIVLATDEKSLHQGVMRARVRSEPDQRQSA